MAKGDDIQDGSDVSVFCFLFYVVCYLLNPHDYTPFQRLVQMPQA